MKFKTLLGQSKLCSFNTNVEFTRDPKGESVFRFHLREASSVRHKFNDELWLFGRDSRARSVAVRVENFYPSFLVDIHEWPDTSIQELRGSIANIKPVEWAPSAMISTDVVSMVRLIGFSYNRKRKMLRVTYRNPSLMRQIKDLLEEARFDVGLGKRSKPRIYHDDWEWENQLLHENQIKLQSWIDLSAYEVRVVHKQHRTTSNLELRLLWKPGSMRMASTQRPHLMLMASVRIRCVSQKGAEVKKPLLPMFAKPKDKVIMICSTLYWLGRDTTPLIVLFTVGSAFSMKPLPEPNTYRLECKSEKQMLEAWLQLITLADVDVFVYLSDIFPTMLYLCQRLEDKNISKFKDETCRFFERAGLFYYKTPGRTRADLKYVLKKTWCDPGLPAYTLKAALEHHNLYRKHVPKEMYLIESLETTLRQHETDKVEKELVMENGFLADWEMVRSSVLEVVEVSAQCYCDLTQCVSSGQQVRVWHKLMSEWHREKLFVNKEQLFRPALLVPKTQNSFANPEELPNIPPRDRKRKKTKTTQVKRTYMKTFTGELVEMKGKQAQKRQRTQAKKKKRYTGGLVYEPIAGYYVGEDERTGTLDFASLYPSIIIGYGICYMALVYDKEVLDDPSIEKQYVPIGETQSLVLVKGQRTLLPKMINQLLQQRKAVKAQMFKAKKGSFERRVLNSKQLSCKVTQNATYGFLGVRRNGKLPCNVLASSVCCIGQWMNRMTKQYVLKTNGCVVYGDTDSVMVQYPKPPILKGDEPEEIRLNRAYYKLFGRIAEEASKMFPHPNKLEFEGMKWPFALFMKKNYAALMWNEFDPTKPEKIHVSGLTCKKRDKCLWVRNFGQHIVDMLMYRREEEIEPFIRSELKKLVHHKVPIQDLTVTCEMKAISDYSHENLIQVTVAKKITQRTGRVFPPGSRISYVVIEGSGKHYTRGEDPCYAEKHKLKIDFAYYINIQLMKSLKTLLCFHPRIKLDKLASPFLRKVDRQSRGLQSIEDMMRPRKKRKTK